MADHSGKAALAAIVEGLKGVTPGPWWADSERSEGGDGRFDAFAVYGPEQRYGRPSSICDTHNSGEIRIQHEHDTTPWDEQGRVNMDHISRCDPATMQSIAAYVVELEAALQAERDRADRAEKERDQLRAGVNRMSDEEELQSETSDGVDLSAAHFAAKLAAAEKERDALKRRGDNHWETLRGIRDIARTSGDLDRIIQWVNDSGTGYTESASATIASLTDRATTAEAALADARKDNERRQQNMRDQFEALCAMRNDLNEMLPIQHLEADLRDGPETSVFCAKVVEAVRTALAAAENDALERAAQLIDDTPSRALYAFYDDLAYRIRALKKETANAE